MPYDFSELDQKLAGTQEWLSTEYKGLRTGRATPALLEGVRVNAYGSSTPLKQVASVNVEDARTLRIAPYDASLVKEVEKAIASEDLGVGTSADDQQVRVSFPELTEERRKEFVKVAKQKLEEARTAVRQARDEIWNDVQEQERDGTITEDDKYTLKEDMQKRVDAANEKLETSFKQKEDEILNK